MTYKKRLIILLSIIAAMFLAYVLSVIFSYDRSSSRSSYYAWLDSGSAQRISRIYIDNTWEQYELLKKDDNWFININGRQYPARTLRVEDFIGFFTTRAARPVRSENASAHERFGLDDSAARVTVYGEYSVILDLLLGDYDNMGNDMYFRKVGQNEVRSGDSSIYAYISGSFSGWYNLRLFPESADGSLNSSSVQRVTVYNESETQVFARRGREWIVSGVNIENPDINGIENYVSFIVNAEGDDFIEPDLVSEYDFNYSRIVLELGNGRTVTIGISEPDEVNKRYAKINGGGLTYVLPLWVTTRLLRTASSFELL